MNRPLIGGLRAELRAVELGIEAPELHEGIVAPRSRIPAAVDGRDELGVAYWNMWASWVTSPTVARSRDHPYRPFQRPSRHLRQGAPSWSGQAYL